MQPSASNFHFLYELCCCYELRFVKNSNPTMQPSASNFRIRYELGSCYELRFVKNSNTDYATIGQQFPLCWRVWLIYEFCHVTSSTTLRVLPWHSRPPLILVWIDHFIEENWNSFAFQLPWSLFVTFLYTFQNIVTSTLRDEFFIPYFAPFQFNKSGGIGIW